MDQHAQQYYEVMESLEAHPGLKIFLDELRGFQEAIASQWATVSPENLRFEQGRFAGLKQATDLFATIGSLKAQALADDLDEAEAA